MNLTRKILWAFGIAASLYCCAALSEEIAETLCSTEEDVYFSCFLDSKKIASICALGNNSPQTGYVQYRYGVRNKIEFKFPKSLIPPEGVMYITDVSRSAMGIGKHVKFKSNGHVYVISNSLIPGEFYVAKKDLIVFDELCNSDEYIPFSEKAASGLPRGKVEKTDDWLGPGTAGFKSRIGIRPPSSDR